MRIAQVAPLYESVPPRLYGGTERVVDGVTEELVRRGHEVTLFASGDSNTSARLIPCCTRGLRLDPSVRDHVAYAEMIAAVADVPRTDRRRCRAHVAVRFSAARMADAYESIYERVLDAALVR